MPFPPVYPLSALHSYGSLIQRLPYLLNWSKRASERDSWAVFTHLLCPKCAWHKFPLQNWFLFSTPYIGKDLHISLFLKTDCWPPNLIWKHSYWRIFCIWSRFSIPVNHDWSSLDPAFPLGMWILWVKIRCSVLWPHSRWLQLFYFAWSLGGQMLKALQGFHDYGCGLKWSWVKLGNRKNSLWPLSTVARWKNMFLGQGDKQVI